MYGRKMTRNGKKINRPGKTGQAGSLKIQITNSKRQNRELRVLGCESWLFLFGTLSLEFQA
jgi:hypothetical protein